MVTKHLAIFNKQTAKFILSGQKTIESRFSKSRLAPFGQVSVGDLIYIKPAGEDIIGQFRVKKVISFEGLDEGDFKDIFAKYGKKLMMDEAFLETHKSAKYGTLIFIGEVDQLITSPIKYSKRDLRGWVVLE